MITREILERRVAETKQRRAEALQELQCLLGELRLLGELLQELEANESATAKE